MDFWPLLQALRQRRLRTHADGAPGSIEPIAQNSVVVIQILGGIIHDQIDSQSRDAWSDRHRMHPALVTAAMPQETRIITPLDAKGIGMIPTGIGQVERPFAAGLIAELGLVILVVLVVNIPTH